MSILSIIRNVLFAWKKFFFFGFVVGENSFNTIATPLTDVVKKNVAFTWSVEQDKAFTDLIERLCSASLLALRDFNCTFEIMCDASGIGIGVVLIQDRKAITYFSEKLIGASL